MKRRKFLILLFAVFVVSFFFARHFYYNPAHDNADGTTYDPACNSPYANYANCASLPSEDREKVIYSPLMYVSAGIAAISVCGIVYVLVKPRFKKG